MTSTGGVGGHTPRQGLNAPDYEMTPKKAGESSRQNESLQLQRSISPPIKMPLQAAPAEVTADNITLNEDVKAQLSADLAALQSNQNDPLAKARYHMLMEGRVLKTQSGKSFEEVQTYLLGTVDRPPHELLTGLGYLEKDLETNIINMNCSESGELTFSKESWRKLLVGHWEGKAELLVAYNDLQLKALESAPEDIKSFCELSHNSFQDFAKRYAQDFGNKLVEFGEFLKSRFEEAEQLVARSENQDPEVLAEHQKLVETLKSAHNNFSSACDQHFGNVNSAEGKVGGKKNTEAEKLLASIKPKINNLNKTNRVKDLKTNRPMSNHTKVIISAAVPQGIASFIHFGLVRTLFNTYLEKKFASLYLTHKYANLAIRGTAGGTMLGLAHKLVSDFVRPLFQGPLEYWAGTLTKVGATEVFPDVPQYEVDQLGNVNPRSNLEELQKENNQRKNDFHRSQTSFYFHTASGDNIFYWAFGISQGSRVAIDSRGPEQNKHHFVAVSGASGIGGAVAATGQAEGKYLSTSDGIPTHELVSKKKTWLDGVFPKMLQDVQMWKGESRADFIGKLAGAIQGEFVTLGINEISKMLTNDPTKQKLILVAGTVLSAPGILAPFLSNVGATVKSVADSDKLTKISDYYKVPWNNLSRPNRQLKDTRKNLGAELNKRGKVADGFTSLNNFVNGLGQVMPQATVSTVESVVEKATQMTSGIRRRLRPQNDVEGNELT